jgi:hypothetical protein
MSQRGPVRNVLVVGLIGVAAFVAACGAGGTPSGTPSVADTTTGSATSSVTTAGSANPLDTPAAATSLCDAVRPKLSEWDPRNPTPNKIGFNITLQMWAFDTGGADGNIKLVGDKSAVDTLTEQACPDVRGQALRALGVADLASAIAVP